jgi:hypothetical protein
MGYIYRLVSPSGKAYIGQTKYGVMERFRQHQWPSSSNTAIHKAIIFHGADKFSVETVVEVPDNLLDHYEKLFIDVYGTFGRFGYNQTRGGDINPMYDESVKKKCIATNSKPEVKAKHKASMKKAMSKESTRASISKTMKMKLSGTDAKAKRSKQMRDVWTGDNSTRKANISKAHANPEVKAKQSASLKKSLNSKDTREKHLKALHKNAKNPEVQAKKREAMKAFWARKKAGLTASSSTITSPCTT